MELKHIKKYVTSVCGEFKELPNTKIESPTRALIEISVGEGKDLKKHVFLLEVFDDRQENYRLTYGNPDQKLSQREYGEVCRSYSREGEVISKIEHMLFYPVGVEGITQTDKVLLDAIKFLDGECKELEPEAGDKFASLRYKVLFPNLNTCEIEGWVGSSGTDTKRSTDKLAINRDITEVGVAIEYLQALSGVQDLTTIKVEKPETQGTKEKVMTAQAEKKQYMEGLEKVERVVNGSGKAEFKVVKVDTDHVKAHVVLPFDGYQESYGVSYYEAKPKDKYEIEASRACIKKLQTEEEVAREIHRLISTKKDLMVKDHNDNLTLIQVARLAGGSCEDIFTNMPSRYNTYQFKFPNGNTTKFKTCAYACGAGLKKGIKIDTLDPTHTMKASKHILEVAGHPEMIAYTGNTVDAEKNNVRQVPIQTTMPTSDIEAIKNRGPHTNEINKLCGKYGIKGAYTKRVGVPKFRWNGSCYVRVRAQKGTLVPGCIDVDCYTLVHPNGNQYYLYVDTDNSYYAVSTVATPYNMIAVSTNQRDIIEAIK